MGKGRYRPLDYSLEGQRLGRLTVLWPVGRNRTLNVMWLCQCDCGGMTIATNNNLKLGSVQSCGCIVNEPKVHGMARRGNKSSEYLIWVAIKQRCHNPNCKDYRLYGARGIQMCERWQNSFVDFLSDMGPRPSDLSIDRINNDGNYEPSNCRWATAKQQVANSRRRTLCA